MLATTEVLIQKTPGVVGGDACIRSTRIAVWMLVNAYQLGITEAELLEDYPGLSQEDLNATWDYYRANRDEIDARICADEEDDDETT